MTRIGLTGTRFSKEEGDIIEDSLDFFPKMGRRPPGRVNGPSL